MEKLEMLMMHIKESIEENTRVTEELINRMKIQEVENYTKKMKQQQKEKDEYYFQRQQNEMFVLMLDILKRLDTKEKD